MLTQQERFWQRFRQLAADRGMVLYPHKPGSLWNNNRHVGLQLEGVLHFVYHIRRDRADVSLEIHIRKGDIDGANRVLDHLFAHSLMLESVSRSTLQWERRPEKDNSFIRFPITTGGLKDEASWIVLQKTMINAMARLEAAVRFVLKEFGMPKYDKEEYNNNE